MNYRRQKKKNTRGPLGWLAIRRGLTKRKESVAVMDLVEYHLPKTPEEVEALIAAHQSGACGCGCRSTGTVLDFAQRLFSAQASAEFIARYPLDEFTDSDCVYFMRDLFCVAPLKKLEAMPAT